MEEIELTSDGSNERIYFNQKDFYSGNLTLYDLLDNYCAIDDINDQEEILKNLIEVHKIERKAFYEMNRVFKRRLLRFGNKYWVHPLKKDVLKEIIEKGKEEYENAKYRFLKFTFNGGNNAQFRYKPVGEFDFEDGMSCYAEILLEYILKTYDEIYVVKGRNDLRHSEVEAIQGTGKAYRGKNNIAMLKCKLEQTSVLSDGESFHYYDVVHDPGIPPGTGNG